jgi:hypothetical protein
VYVPEPRVPHAGAVESEAADVRIALQHPEQRKKSALTEPAGRLQYVPPKEGTIKRDKKVALLDGFIYYQYY